MAGFGRRRFLDSQKNESGFSKSARVRKERSPPKKSWRIKGDIWEEIRVVPEVVITARVLTLRDDRKFAFGKEPIKGKSTMYKLGGKGWSKVPDNQVDKIILELRKANDNFGV